jgi:hypothetical protein
MGLRLNIIIIAEGAIDIDGNAITASMVKDVGSFIMFDYCITSSKAVFRLYSGQCSFFVISSTVYCTNLMHQ